MNGLSTQLNGLKPSQCRSDRNASVSYKAVLDATNVKTKSQEFVEADTKELRFSSGF